MNVKKHKFIVIGGGKIALRKTLKILEYGGSVICISPEFEKGFYGLAQVECIASTYDKKLLRGGVVIAATNNRELNEMIYYDCQQLGLFCSLIDNGEESDFIFSAAQQTEDVIISVSTKGKDPSLAKNTLTKLMEAYTLDRNVGNPDRPDKEKIMKIKIGTRGSKLALTQTQWVVDQLTQKFPHIQFETQIIVTKGDRIQNVSIEKIGDKGAFVKEIEDALLVGTIDMAVHSMKDMPAEVTSGLIFTESPIREDATDTLVTPHPISSFMELPQNAVVATGSKRRSYQLLEKRPDIKVIGIRGNVDTRIKKMLEQNLDGVILATAGLNRLKLNEAENYRCVNISVEDMVPAPAQGILGIQIREGRPDLLDMINQIKDLNTNVQLVAERSFLKALGGNCHLPIGAYCKLEEEKLSLVGLFGTEDGAFISRHIMVGEQHEAENIGVMLARKIKEEVESYGR
jgi:hydroxymethylbilane synthase